jgi:hypothetical protein
MWRRQHPRYDGTRESIGTDFFGAYGRCMHGRAVANVLGNPVLTTSACRLRPTDMLVRCGPWFRSKTLMILLYWRNRRNSAAIRLIEPGGLNRGWLRRGFEPKAEHRPMQVLKNYLRRKPCTLCWLPVHHSLVSGGSRARGD